MGARYFVDADTAAAKERVKRAALNAQVEAIDGAVSVVIGCYLERPKSRKKDEHPTSRPDVDNYAKLVLDALNGIAWHDDAQVVSLSILKAWTDPDYGSHTRIDITPML